MNDANLKLGPGFSHALDIAYLWHRGQQRKGRATPYLAHLMSVASLVLEAGGDEELAIAGLLHDAIEDAEDAAEASRRQELIRREFGSRVERAVLGCTDGDPEKRKDLEWRERKERYVSHLEDEVHPDAVAVSLCDKLHNVRAILRDLRRQGDHLWDRFNSSREQNVWYYGSLADAYRSRTEELEEVLPLFEDHLNELERVVGEIVERTQGGAAPTPESSARTKARPTDTRVIAVDWSGAKSRASRKIWMAEVVDGRLVRLENGRSRQELVRHLIAQAEEDPGVVVGLDFAFSFPEWFLDQRGLETGAEAWRLVSEQGEEWLDSCEEPFWGRPGRTRPDLPAHFRKTEEQAHSVVGAQPKSVFQIGGAGAVGTGSLRGMPYLSELSEAGFSVWPFEDADWPLVVEIYPRLLTGDLVKSDGAARAKYLDGAFPEMNHTHVQKAEASADAFDAAVSAVVMARHLEEIRSLSLPSADVLRREGSIWWPEEVREPQHIGLESEVECPFCEMTEDFVVARSAHAVAIEDAYPVAKGHTLVLPRAHASSVFELPARVQADLWELVADVRDALSRKLDVSDFTIGINDGPAAGQTVAHAHIHVIPRRAGDVEDPRGGVRWVRPNRAAYWQEQDR